MGCFRGFLVNSSTPAKCLRRSGSKVWRRMSGRNSARYTINQAFAKNEVENPTYKMLGSTIFSETNSALKKYSEGQVQNNSTTEEVLFERNIISHYNSTDNEKMLDDCLPHILEPRLDSEIFQKTELADKYEDPNNPSFQTKSMENEANCQLRNKIKESLVRKEEYESSEEDEDLNHKINKEPNDIHLRKFDVVKASCSTLNRHSRDYDLIEYPSINLEDLMSGGSDSSSTNHLENTADTLKTSRQEITNTTPDSASSQNTFIQCAIETLNETTVDMIINSNAPPNPDKSGKTISKPTEKNETSDLAGPGEKYDLKSESHINSIETNLQEKLVHANIIEPNECQLDIMNSSGESHYFSCEDNSENSCSNSEELNSSYESIPNEIEEVIIVEIHSDIGTKTETNKNQEDATETKNNDLHKNQKYIFHFSHINLDDITETCVDSTFDTVESRNILFRVELENEIQNIDNVMKMDIKPHEEQNGSTVRTREMDISSQSSNESVGEKSVHLEKYERYGDSFQFVLKDEDGREIGHNGYIPNELESLQDSHHDASRTGGHDIEETHPYSENSDSLHRTPTANGNQMDHIDHQQNCRNAGIVKMLKISVETPVVNEIKFNKITSSKPSALFSNSEGEQLGPGEIQTEDCFKNNHHNTKRKSDHIIKQSSPDEESFDTLDTIQNKNDIRNSELNLQISQSDQNSKNIKPAFSYSNFHKNSFGRRRTEDDIVELSQDNHCNTYQKGDHDIKESSSYSKIVETLDKIEIDHVPVEIDDKMPRVNHQQNQKDNGGATKISERVSNGIVEDFDGITPLKPDIICPKPPKSDKRRRVLSFKMLGAEAFFKQSSLEHLYDLMRKSHQDLQVTTTRKDELRFIINWFEPSKPRIEGCNFGSVLGCRYWNN